MQLIRIGDRVRVFKYRCYGYHCVVDAETDEKRWVSCKQEEESAYRSCSNCGEFKTDLTGEVVYKNKYFVAVKNKHASECFLAVDIKNGDYVIQKKKGG